MKPSVTQLGARTWLVAVVSIAASSLATLTMASDAAAQGAPLRARLRFTAPPGCGSVADFSARVQRRSSRVRFVTRGVPDRVSVTIVQKGSGLGASVVLASGSRQLVERTIEAETCDDALDALALVVAVTLEGQDTKRHAPRRVSPRRATPRPAANEAESTPSAPVPESPSTEPAPTPTAIEPAPTSDAPAPTLEAPPTKPPAPTPPTPVDTPPRANADDELSAWSAGAGAGVAFNLGAAPSVLPGWFVYGRFGLELVRPWSPEISVSFASLSRDGFDDSSGSAAFRLQALSIELCPLKWRLGPVDWMPCVQAEYGRLKARGYDTIAAAEYSRPWTVMGASLQIAAHVSIIELRAQLGAGVPLTRDTFRFEPDPTVHHVPPVTFSTSLAAGLRFP